MVRHDTPETSLGVCSLLGKRRPRKVDIFGFMTSIFVGLKCGAVGRLEVFGLGPLEPQGSWSFFGVKLQSVKKGGVQEGSLPHYKNSERLAPRVQGSIFVG